MGKWLIVLSMLFATAAAAAPVWTWLDENGQRHFSDRPVEGAEQIEVQGAQGFSRSAPAPAARPAPGAAAAEQPTQPYRAFEIASPLHQETLWNIGAVLDVRVDVAPGLQPGHRLDAYLDGERVIVGSTTPQFSIPDVFRGLHTLQAVIMDSSGREVLRSREITIMVQQTSLLNPNNPNSPRNAPAG